MASFLRISGLLVLIGCTGDVGRSAAPLTEVEITVERAGTTTIRRADISYAGDGGRLRQIAFSVNGNPAGQMEAEYRDGRLVHLDILDADGDRGEATFAYDGKGRVKDYEFTAPSVYTVHHAYDYDDGRGGVAREVTTQMTQAAGTAHTSYRRFEHDDSRRLTKVTDIEGQSTSAFDLRYDELDRVQRVTSYAGTSVSDQVTYAYDPSGRLESASGTNNSRWDLRYTADGYIDEIRQLRPGSGETVTIRYRYGSGHVAGLLFTPDVPHGDLFDLRGTSFSSVDFLSLAPAGLNASVPSPVGGGDGGGGGPVTCAGYEAQNACQVCELTTCCSQVEQCVNNSECVAYIDCIEACSDYDCYDTCGDYYPSGRYYLERYYHCLENNCQSECF